MIHLKFRNVAAIAVALGFCLFNAPGWAASVASATNASSTIIPLPSGPDDAMIAYWTARILEQQQYSRQTFDADVSKRFFDGYLKTLDPRHEYFLQSDIDQFEHYRTNLDIFTLGTPPQADLKPAFQIFNRFLERLAQRTTYVDKLLHDDHFTFNSNERILDDRREAPYPKDLAAAQELWGRRLRYDYLQERLDREFSATNGGTILPLPKTADAEIAADLEKHYNWILHTATNYDGGDVLQFYLNALTHAYDPHSDYLNESHEQNFKIEMSLSLGGIGAQLTDDYGYCKIQSLVPGGPAEQSGQIKPNEYIVKVAQSNQPPVNVVDMKLNKVVELIRGPKGTQVTLTLEDKNNPSSQHKVTLTRDEIKLENQEAKAQLIEQPDGHGQTNRIGVINVPSFYAPMDTDGHSYISSDTARLIKKLESEKVAGIILDMRNNPGGSLEEAIQFTGLFIKSGPVVLARNWNGQIETDVVSNSAALYSGPLVVLVNRFSASAAEIAAAALQDYGRAVVVGDTSTHGKGTVQSLIDLSRYPFIVSKNSTNDPGTLKLTIRKFYRITGGTTQLNGVRPDIVLPDVWNYNPDIGEISLDNALPGLPLPEEISSQIHYAKLDKVAPYIEELRRLSLARVATNQDFNYIRQDIAEYKKSLADKTVTLNEQDALRQRKQDSARNLARDIEEAVRPLPQERIYNLTVENCASNGLPAPQPLCITNMNAVITSTNANGSVCIMTTNGVFAVGVPLNQFETNTPSGPAHLGTVVTQSASNDNARLDETINIIQDYISLLSKNNSVVVNQRSDSQKVDP
ncbi:MAG TPA: carboxy terminal-processing peptidase [Verrucomicrobiae bacterium]|nr:carboxy terminal-processing peptidase [Verrucomicrobiae bacterium]